MEGKKIATIAEQDELNFCCEVFFSGQELLEVGSADCVDATVIVTNDEDLYRRFPEYEI